MADRPPIGSSILAKKSQSRSRRSRAVRLLSILLAVLKTTQHPACLALLELAISIPFNSKNPSAGDKVLGFELPDVDKVKDIIVEPRLDDES